MPRDRLIAGMWGTSNLRVFLLEEGMLSATREGPGASKLAQSDFEPVLFELIADWLTPGLSRDIILAGMVGSTIGWVDVPYTQCPIGPERLALGTLHEARGQCVHIIHGLACTNIFGQPDVMRGEETELVGLFGLDDNYRTGDHLVCIPGTHAKWARLRDGQILDFMTSVSGELFSGLRRNGVIVGSDGRLGTGVTAAFKDGVDQARGGNVSFLHRLFTVRARQVLGVYDDDSDGAIDRLSGLIIGSDVAAALSYPDHESTSQAVTVIGNDGIAERYGAAIEMCGRKAELISAETTAVSGFWALSDAIKTARKTHELVIT